MARGLPISIGVLIGCLILALVILSVRYPLPLTGAVVGVQPAFELTKTDLFAQKGWTGNDVTVFGIQLGDTQEAVIEKLGAPDIRKDFGSITNFEYSRGLAMPNVGMLLHFSNNKLTRITIKEPFNRFLGNTTKIGTVRKEDVYRLFGAPSKIQLMSFFTTYTYEDRDLEIFLDAKKLNGFSFVLPEAIEEFEQLAAGFKNGKNQSGIAMEDIEKNVFYKNN